MMTFYQAIKSGLRSKISGRASRSEYWYFQLFLITFLVIFFGAARQSGAVHFKNSMLAIPYCLIVIFGLPYLIATKFSMTVRRLHDVGLSGWYAVMMFIPLISLIIFYFSLKKGNVGPNTYGLDPLEINSKLSGHLNKTIPIRKPAHNRVTNSLGIRFKKKRKRFDP